jgi:hypothetical protein
MRAWVFAVLPVSLLLGASASPPWFAERAGAVPDKAEPRVFSMGATAVDLDGDGDADLVIATEYRPNRLLINDGTGRFADESASRLPQVKGDHEDMAVADFDRDGDLDLLFVAEDDQVLGYYLNDGSGRFSTATDRLPAARGTANGVIATDVDGDGDADLVFANAGADFVWINDGSGRFSDDSARRMPPTTSVSQDVVAGDLDRDGDLDLVFGNEDGNAVLLNDGNGVFTDATATWLPSEMPAQESRNVDLFDADRDGDLDLYVSNVRFGNAKADMQDRLLINRGGRFADESAARLPLRDGNTVCATAVDLDGDRDLDLVLGTVGLPQTLRGSGFDSPYRVLLNTGRGRFVDATARVFPASTVGHGFDVDVLDADRDGRLDLFLASRGGPDRLLFGQPGRRR